VSAQQPDVVIFDERSSRFRGWRAGPLFDPSSESVDPSMNSTGRYRGYVGT
jgi:hypothetical protein